MDDLELTVRWSRPDAPEERFIGSLSYSKRGIVVTSDEPMVAGKRKDNGSVEYTLGTVSWPIVHGVADDGRFVTLLEAESQYGFPYGKHITRAHAALLGDRPVAADAFREVRMCFDWLTAWLEPPMIYDRGPDDDAPQMIVDLELKTVASVDLDGAAIAFMAGTTSHTSRHQISVTRETWVSVVPSEPKTWRQLLDEYVRPLQDFLVVALGRPVQLISLHLAVAGPPPITDDDLWSAPFHDVKIPLIQREPQDMPGRGELNAYPSTVLLPTEQFLDQAVEIVRGWYDVNLRNRTAVIRLNAQAYARFNYLGNQSAAVAQAFESLFLGECETKQKTKSEHAERVAKVCKALTEAGLDSEVVSWATAVVQARNDKSFPERFADVIALSGQLGQYLTTKLPNLADQLTTLRHSVSHGSASSDRPSTNDPAIQRMYYLKEIGTWIMRTALLELSGAAVASKAVENPFVTHAVAQLVALQAKE
jgi:ApeA N-terminal domain 1